MAIQIKGDHMFSVRRSGLALAFALTLGSPVLASTLLIDGLGSHVARGNDQFEVVQGAEAASISAFDQSNVKVSGGNISWLTLNDGASADISGGDISWLMLNGNSVARLNGAASLSWILFDGSNSRAEVFANNVKYTGGHLSGNWYNGTAFSFWAIPAQGLEPTSVMPSNIVITPVPEPAQLVLLSLGMLLIYARTRHTDRPHKPTPNNTRLEGSGTGA
ncbi:MAG: hypothetical protein C0487_15550 [Leptothrix sp. (in: Bacteria)]|nr:hypothetical protein [Leptothrix sp. (in: b-proteobacteria)]